MKILVFFCRARDLTATESARGVAEVNPDSEASKELMEFLDSEEVQKALVRDA